MNAAASISGPCPTLWELEIEEFLDMPNASFWAMRRAEGMPRAAEALADLEIQGLITQARQITHPTWNTPLPTREASFFASSSTSS